MDAQQIKEKFKSEGAQLEREIMEKVSGYILAAFGLVAGLAWNDAIQTLINEIFKVQRNSIAVKFIYAAGITLVLVIVSVYLVRWFSKKPENRGPQAK